MALHIEMEIPDDRVSIAAALEGLCALSTEVMRGQRYPPLYSSGIRYRAEPRGQDDWQHAGRLLASLIGDCEDLVGYRVAELRLAGESARGEVIETGEPGKYHAVVRRANGQLEDPTRILLRKEASTMGSTTMKRKPKICLTKAGEHCVGSISLPMAGGKTLRVSEIGFDAWSALDNAVKSILREVDKNPEWAALLPPQAGVALLIAAKISKMSEPGLKKLIEDERATASQRKLAAKVLQAKQDAREEAALMQYGHDAPTTGWSVCGGVVGVDLGALSTNLREHRQYEYNPKGNVIVHPPEKPGAPPPAGAPGSYDYTPTKPVQGLPMPGQIDPGTGLVWVADADGPGHWERPRSQVPTGQSLDPSAPYSPYAQGAPGYPPGYPPLGYPGYPPGYPTGSPYPGAPGYPQPSPPMPSGYPGYPQYAQMFPQMYPDQMYGPGPYGPGYPTTYPLYPSQMWPPMAAYPPNYPPMYPPGWDPWGATQPQPLSADEAAAITLWGSASFAQGAFPGYA